MEFSLEPTRDKKQLRRQLQAERMAMIDRHERAMHLQEVLRVWLVRRDETAIGAYWPIKGEFDALPALFRWTEGEDVKGRHRIGLPVIDRETKQLRFHRLVPGLPDGRGRLRHPQAQGHQELRAADAAGALRGLRPGRLRLGYGGGFYDRTLATLSAAALHGGGGLRARLHPVAGPSRTTCRWTPCSPKTAWPGKSLSEDLTSPR
jgi:5-formyltetrahydrofolate cyclo-ligase